MTPSTDDESLHEAESGHRSVSHRLIQGISTHAIFKLDSEGCIESWSDASQSLYGYDAPSIINEHLGKLFADKEGPNPELEDHLAQAKTDARELEHWNKRADGSVFWATLTLSPLWNDGFEGYAVISQDTTVKKQYEQMLERQNDRLKEFTDIIAHDLRNPLNVIDGRLELYRETREEEHIEHIEETTDRMERLVDDLLRVARHGNVVTDPEPIDIEAVIDTAWEGTGNASTDGRLQYESVPLVGADHDRLCELFENLFRNAIDHGGSGVTIRVGPLNHGFYVEDDGPGIPADYRDEVFDHGLRPQKRVAATGSRSSGRSVTPTGGTCAPPKANLAGHASKSLASISSIN